METKKLRVAAVSVGIILQFATLCTALNSPQALLAFNPIGITSHVWEGQGGPPVQLDCGVYGVYESCHWEHNNMLYQLDKVTDGDHSDMKTAAPANSIMNQCGIIIKHVNKNYAGVWSCNVLTFGPTLTASKNITIIMRIPKPLAPYYVGWAVALGIGALLMIIAGIAIACLKKKNSFSRHEHKPLQEDTQQQQNQLI